MKNWRVVAKAEGRVCPECGQPVSKTTWSAMCNYKGNIPVHSCWTCRYAHWDIPLHYAGGSAYRDNQDREALGRIREG